MKKTYSIIIAIFFLCGFFAIINNIGGNKIAFGYGYDGVTTPQIRATSLQTTDKSPLINGTYNYGPIESIVVYIRNSSGDVVWTGSPTSISNPGVVTGNWQSWEIADNTIPELSIGVYEISATVTDIADAFAEDQTNNELTIKNDFSSLSASFDKNDVSAEKTSEKKVKIRIKNYGEATHYMVSEKSDFRDAVWKTISDSFSVKVGSESEKYTFYIKLKDAANIESETIKKSVTYLPLRKISTSPTKTTAKNTIIQRGKRFSKNSSVLAYFSKKDGSYYPPKKIATDSKGSFLINYRINKAPGKYSWYVVDEKTGRKSNISKYTVK